MPRLPLWSAILKGSFGKPYDGFRIHYSPQHAVGLTGSYIAGDRTHPLAASVQARFENRDRNGLWWSVPTPAQTGKNNSTTRHRVGRRLRHAFLAALKSRGLDADGNPLPPASGTSNAQTKGLRGSLRLIPGELLLDAKGEDIVKQCSVMLNDIAAKQRYDEYKSSKASTSTTPPVKHTNSTNRTAQNVATKSIRIETRDSPQQSRLKRSPWHAGREKDSTLHDKLASIHLTKPSQGRKSDPFS